MTFSVLSNIAWSKNVVKAVKLWGFDIHNIELTHAAFVEVGRYWYGHALLDTLISIES